MHMRSLAGILISVIACLTVPPTVRAEGGYKLWLRYAPVADAPTRAAYAQAVRQIAVPGDSPTAAVIRDELRVALRSMLGTDVPVASQPAGDGAIVVEVVKSLPPELGDEGYSIRSYTEPRRQIEITARTDVGALYGTFHLLRLMQTGQPIGQLDITSKPRLQRRLLNHWDNLDGTIERGYAGNSLWKWDELPGTLDPRYIDYARANASIGVNGVVLNNVNANPKMLTAEYLKKVAAIANVFRPYGIRVYLSANFDAPRSLGKLPTADPLNADVVAWWKSKADEIYSIIPDFGGFLVKANSEGQPGPQGYGRTHADGANLLADALAPHGGIVMWRAFVYEESVDPDRAKRAYIEFTNLDGKFRDNVIVQVKNGAVDFQPREPFHPLFGGMTKTPVMAELQIAPEYFGKHRHLVYFGPMWKEFLDADTHAKGAGSTVAKVIDGSVYGKKLTGIAGVANTGTDRNWTGHDVSQANWYAFGRLAWDPDLSAAQIADEWSRMTLTHDATALDTLRTLLLDSWETYVSYNAPLGLTHLQADERDGPDPGSTALHRDDWNPPYYHRAAKDGIGFDRTATGSNAVAQYFPEVRDRFAKAQTCPEKFLLWFHHVPWTHRLTSGRTLWEELCRHYTTGSERASVMQTTWQSLEGKIDAERFRAVAERLELQSSDAKRWRDRALGYFSQVSGLPIVATAAAVQTPVSPGRVTITRDKPDGIYNAGDTAKWTFEWHGGTDVPAVQYILKRNGLKELGRGTLQFTGNRAVLETKFDESGAILVETSWREKRVFAGAMASPRQIKPASTPPDDFDAFWKSKLDELARVPANPKLEAADAGKPNIDYWKVTLDNIRGTQVRGQLARPKAGDKLPALLIVQYAGVYPLQKNWAVDRAAEGWLTLNVLAHDLPIDEPEAFYKDQFAGPLKNYWAIGNDDRDTSYYLRMYLACARAVEYLRSRPDWDGKTLVVMGTSQGGQQALVTGGLVPDGVTAVLAFLPAACDLLGPSIGRMAGFPNWYEQVHGKDAEKVRAVSRYYDPVHFAARIKVPTLIGVALHDDLAPPASVFAAANQVRSSKEVVILPNAGHQDENGSQSAYNKRCYEVWLPALRRGEAAPVAFGPADQPLDRHDDPTWAAKHTELVERAKRGDIDLYFAGDSITRRWEANHRANWDRNFGRWKPADFGAGGDRTQNLLYRLQNGELDNVHPKVVVLMIGTNNIGFESIPGNDEALVADVVKGVDACLRTIRERAPNAKVLLMGITPRNTNGSTALIPTINRINERLAKLADGKAIRFCSINDQFADASGKLFEGVTDDGLHFTEKGYQIWADAITPTLTEWLDSPAK